MSDINISKVIQQLAELKSHLQLNAEICRTSVSNFKTFNVGNSTIASNILRIMDVVDKVQGLDEVYNALSVAYSKVLDGCVYGPQDGFLDEATEWIELAIAKLGDSKQPVKEGLKDSNVEIITKLSIILSSLRALETQPCCLPTYFQINKNRDLLVDIYNHFVTQYCNLPHNQSQLNRVIDLLCYSIWSLDQLDHGSGRYTPQDLPQAIDYLNEIVELIVEFKHDTGVVKEDNDEDRPVAKIVTRLSVILSNLQLIDDSDKVEFELAENTEEQLLAIRRKDFRYYAACGPKEHRDVLMINRLLELASDDIEAYLLCGVDRITDAISRISEAIDLVANLKDKTP